jgi:hypothetical protein
MAVAALRSAIAAIDNAEAVDIETGPRDTASAYVAGATAGVGSSEAERLVLGDAEMRKIVQEQVDERIQAAEEYDRLGRDDQAERLRREAAVLSPYVRDPH